MLFYVKILSIFTAMLCLITMCLETNPVFAEESQEGTIEMRLLQTSKETGIAVYFDLGFLPLCSRQNNNFWFFSGSGMTKISLDSLTHDFFPFDEEITHFAYNYEMINSGRPISPDHFTVKENLRKELTKNHQGRVTWLINPAQNTVVSPDERFVLVRFFADNSEVYDIQTGKFITSGEDGETIIGFNHNGHYYCARQSLENTFYLRDKNTQQVIRRYRTITNGMNDRLYGENTANEEYNPFFDGLLFNNGCPVLESPDGKYTLFSLTLYQLGNYLSIIIVCDNDTGNTVSYSCLRNTDFSLFRHVFSHDGKLIALSDGNTGVWLYNFETKSSQNVYTPNSLIGFSFTAQNQLVLWCDPYLIQQRISPSEIQFDPSTGRMTLPTDFAKKSASLFDPSTGSLTPFTNFADKDERIMQYHFSPDGRTALTFVSDPMYYRYGNTGKYVFWYVQTNQKICETSLRYYPTMIISPDWKTLYLGKELPAEPIVNIDTNREQQQRIVEVYDITNITERSDD